MASPLAVIISGCHSGPNPSPGLGVAHSLRAAFPDVRLVGRDFSPAASGLHGADFDEVWIAPPWENSDLGVLWDQLRPRLTQAWMIPTLDLEVAWLATFGHPRILAPSAEALRRINKQNLAVASGLPVRSPDSIPLGSAEREVEDFCRRHGWQVWVKGSTHESRLVRTWLELTRARMELGATWGDEGPFVQAHVKGAEVSLAFAAHSGKLLDAVFLEKRAVTSEGKVWGGEITDVPDSLGESLREALQSLGWTGGGELEFIRDTGGTLWLFDWNPRFPAWIHGATLAGHNLPAVLLGRAAGIEVSPVRATSGSFTRVVMEIPARLPLPTVSAAVPFTVAGTKHPSGMPQLGRRLAQGQARPASPASVNDASLAADLLEISRSPVTPRRALLPRTASGRFALAARLRESIPRLRIAYSVKTNPDPALMALARRHELWAECISDAEVEWAIRCGWSPSEIIANGPVPYSPSRARGPRLAAIFADHLDALDCYLRGATADIVGVRLRPPFLDSRFGVRIDSPDEFSALVALLVSAPAEQQLGLSFHAAASETGPMRWEALALSVIDFAAALEELSGRAFDVIDLGGGWSAADFRAEFEAVLGRLVRATNRLKGQPEVLIEPGKALAEPSMAVLAQVVDVRIEKKDRRSAVIDAGLADVPLVAAFPHRLALIREDVSWLGPGRDQLLGPTCMEADRIGSVHFPADLHVGDLIAICDAGAYDAGMAYSLGRGGPK